MAPVSLQSIVKEFELEVVAEYGNLEEIRISVADVTRPGLQLAGYFDHFWPGPDPGLGNMETAFLDRMESKERYERIDALFSRGSPAWS